MTRVTVAEDIFQPPEADRRGPVSGTGDPSFLVASDDVEGAAAALYAATLRLFRVTDSGAELEDWEDSDDYTPNFVSDVYLTEAGAMIWADTKGEMTPAMAHAMVRVLTEELLAHGVSAHISVPPADLRYGDHVWSPPEVPEDADEGARPRVWFVIRSVPRRTTTGKEYDDCEYWDGHGWTAVKTDGQTWAEPPNEFVIQLRSHPRTAPYGEPVAVHLKADDSSGPWPMPPKEIRPGFQAPGPVISP